MTGRLEGKVALITGGSSGIGRTSAVMFAREGARLVIADVDITEGRETLRMVHEAGGEAIFVKADVTDTFEVEALVNQAVKEYGRLNCAFNNAGVVGATAPTAECTEENWDFVMNVNLKGVWLCMKYEIRQMIGLGGGAIVNTASILGQVATDKQPAYVASKHGVIGLTKAAALEYAKAGIRVNAICPGPTLTGSRVEARLFSEDPQAGKEKIAEIPMGRMGLAQEIAEAAVWLCSDAASYLTGHAMTVDGGLLAK